MIMRKRYWAIYIVGLSINITASFFKLFYMSYETAFNTFNSNSENMYHIIEKQKQVGDMFAFVPQLLSVPLVRIFKILKPIIYRSY